ncbi:MAG TPA: nucleotidyltransferase family protein [Candidatus Limnocylindria bacterium]|nr:nucleotidyltransferase family protein [Candidatus Limnocylindria bacterium]
MKAFILAAGLGTRLKPLTDKQPKVMVEVGGQKILERTIEQLKKAGVDDLIINTHYFPEVVTDYFGNGCKWGVKVKYSFEPEILGTAGGLKKCQADFENEKEFLVVYGDNAFDLDFRGIINEPFNNSCCVVMLFDRSKSPNSGAAGGVVEKDDKGMIRAFLEVGDNIFFQEFLKGDQRPYIPYVNGGVYKCTPEIFKLIPENQFYDFGKQVFPEMLKKQMPIKTYIIDPKEALYGVDTKEYLEKANKYFNHKP